MSITRREFIGAASAGSVMLAGASPAKSLDPINDPLGVRKDFPGLQKSIFLDSAYTALSPIQAVRAAQAFIESIAMSPPNVPEMLKVSVQTRERYAQLVGASVEEIGLLYATSDGENIVTNALDLKAGDNIVIDDLHYSSTYVLYQRLKQERGIEVRIVRNQQGATPPELFAEMVDEKTRLISVSWISHYNGYRQNLQGLADMAHAHDAYLYVDAMQGIGMLELDVRAVDVDFFTTGGYKYLLAGYGVAPLFVRKELLPMVKPDRSGGFQAAKTVGDHEYELHQDGRKYQYATMAFGAVYHLNAALKYILDVGIGNIERHSLHLANRLSGELRRQGFDVLTPRGNASGIVSFKHGRTGKFVDESLKKAGIFINIYNDEQDYVRIGFGLYNNESEIDEFLKVSASWA